MSRVCQVTGKKPMKGHHVSHANNKTIRTFEPKNQSPQNERLTMREKIKLESSAGTGHFYTTTKNKRTTPDKLEIKKYDPKARKHVLYKETKLK